ncbi:hypothetical protein PENTCL1PPCAC_24659 [Pristionchus entomophagus]|uniref:G protein-coupled receptor n=1 Tax=Pristionchus entomophagus TaxID=358040 RepID=A0AAV5U7W9_9BILA|nr:hypothetical protein PENTCL1PPCAC_24659 [Pristionchus entomophagus]
MVTSTSTPGSMEMEVTWWSTSEGECMLMTRLWMRIWKRSQVLDPSPQGVLRVVMRSTLVGIRMGPLTWSSFCLALSMRRVQTENNAATFWDVRVMRMRCSVLSATGLSLLIAAILRLLFLSLGKLEVTSFS